MEPFSTKVPAKLAQYLGNLVEYEPLTITLTEKQAKKLEEKKVIIIRRNNQPIKIFMN